MAFLPMPQVVVTKTRTRTTKTPTHLWMSSNQRPPTDNKQSPKSVLWNRTDANATTTSTTTTTFAAHDDRHVNGGDHKMLYNGISSTTSVTENGSQPTAGSSSTTTTTTLPHIVLPSVLRKQLYYDEGRGRFYELSDTETIPIATLFERALDTLEDAVLHARRIPYDKGWVEYSTKKGADTRMETVVVLGSGWGAHAFMKVADTYKIRLIVVSPTNHFVFTPSTFRVVVIVLVSVGFWWCCCRCCVVVLLFALVLAFLFVFCVC